MEIGIGSLTLVAENETLAGLRCYLVRVLGWDAANWLAIDSRCVRSGPPLSGAHRW
jgi:hypothetical protein